MKVVFGLCLLLLAVCLEARPAGELRREDTAVCPAVDPLLYTVHLPHPVDCNRFLRCDHGVAKPERCPAPLHFNPALQVCDWPVNAGCTKVDGGATEWDEPQVEGPRQEVPSVDPVPEWDGPRVEGPRQEVPSVDPVPEWDGLQVQGPRQEIPSVDLVPDNETPDTYVPSDWLDYADVQNEASQDAVEDDSNAPRGSVEDEDIFDDNV